MTPEEYYKKEFPRDYSIIENLKETGLYSFNTMMQFAELYHFAEITKTYNQSKSINDASIISGDII